ncbi:MAG: hypothetical protein A2675_04175 [Candidatus Yonathbacteria bacterium RIFCSPHIGHO2_01_FULL_51_10]|uniref:DoxX family protein n=1 Tax=Candidatus Yonathbacteria bacterium RIFCSPHIGHO2_01_FULL_51_10 TaxID=1802723 RepID=A0A1G2S3V6_9BACT|nr:MAG: hypothetical protein A2675_04175 [Candidatus Yonathbacteria bacterium RIFCSPHIGHO2_01_FULL_51_10]
MNYGIVSLFPALFDYQFLAIGILRIAVGLLALAAGYRHLKGYVEQTPDQNASPRAVRITVGNILVIAGLLLTVGLYTQGAAIVAAVMWVGAAIISLKRRELFFLHTATYLFIALVCLSFLFLGPGAFAIDLPV